MLHKKTVTMSYFNIFLVRISRKSLIVPADKLIFSPPGLMVVLIALLAGYLCLGNKNRLFDKKCENVVPGPRPWPVIGSLHLMANFTKYPFEAFTNLQKVRQRQMIFFSLGIKNG